MKYILDDSQLDRLLRLQNQEDVQFVKKYVEKRGVFPKFRDLQKDQNTVGFYMPNHSRSNIKLKTYVDLYLGKTLSTINHLLSSKENIILPHKMGGGKTYKSIDGTTLLRSEFEAIAYNIFAVNNVSNQIVVDSQQFMSTCNKMPDFVWENKKLIIEIAGMEGDDYHSKIANAIPCFKKLGYDTIVIDSRTYEKRSDYKNFYIYFSKMLGLPIDNEIVKNPYEYLSYKNVDKKYMEDYIKNHIDKIPKTSNENRLLNQYLKRLYGIGLKEYQKNTGTPRYRSSISAEDVIQYKKNNPTMSNQQIALHFGKHKNTIQKILSGK